MQEWIKIGLIFKPNPSMYWQHSHAQLPTVDYIEGKSTCRVYFASRCINQRSHIGWFDFDLDNFKVLESSSEPVLSPGPIGFFDQHGVYPSCIINKDNQKLMYYIGWNQGVTSPLFYAAIGLLISEDGGNTFTRYSNTPILQRNEYSPCFVSAPYVFHAGSDIYMNYISGFKWTEDNQGLTSFYNIKTAKSVDYKSWELISNIAIDFKNKNEKNIARTWITKENYLYKTWYSYVEAPNNYRIGYATSADGLQWKREDDKVTLIGSDDITFDDVMMCYPCVISYKNKKFMFYNGNSFGKDGIGLAILEDEDA